MFKEHELNILVAMRLMETPVPIPNTMVKHLSADDTWLETARESRWLPDLYEDTSETRGICLEVIPPNLIYQASQQDCLIIA